MKKILKTDKAPSAIGPYSQAIVSNGVLFASGQIGIDPATGQLVKGGIEFQTKQVLENVKAVIRAAGCTVDDVVKTTVFLRDMGDFNIVNSIYATLFQKDPPARSCIAVAGLPRDALVEIEVIAVIKGS
jgi:2-iminobutanoate/2-iminopropanoate deaminase